MKKCLCTHRDSDDLSTCLQALPQLSKPCLFDSSENMCVCVWRGRGEIKNRRNEGGKREGKKGDRWGKGRNKGGMEKGR